MLKGNISKDEVLANPDAVLDVLEFQSNILKQEKESKKIAEIEAELPPEKTITLSKCPQHIHLLLASTCF